MYPFDRFSENAKRVLILAQEEAEQGPHSYIGTEHVLLGLAREENGLAAAALSTLGIHADDLRADIASVLEKESPATSIQEIVPTSRVKRIIELSFQESRDESMNQVDTEHILLAMLLEGEGIGAHVLKDRGVTFEQVRNTIAALRAEGKQEVRRGEAPASNRRHLAVNDGDGNPISADVVFAAGYPRERQDEMLTRIIAAIRGPAGL